MIAVNLLRLAQDLDVEQEPLPEPKPLDYAQPRHRHETPDYVAHDERVNNIGAMSASAVIRMYEEAAKAVEAMGEEQRRVVMRCEEVITLTHAAMERTKEVADLIRDAAKRAFVEIENYAILTQEVAKTCTEIQKKIGIEVGATSS